MIANAPLDFERTVEKSLKDFSLVAVAFRMLFPNLRVAGRGKKRIEILRPERAQFDEISFQGGLKIKIRSGSSAVRAGLAVVLNQLKAHCFEFKVA